MRTIIYKTTLFSNQAHAPLVTMMVTPEKTQHNRNYTLCRPVWYLITSPSQLTAYGPV